VPQDFKTIKGSAMKCNRSGTEVLAPVRIGGSQEQARNSVLRSFNPIETYFGYKRRTPRADIYSGQREHVPGARTINYRVIAPTGITPRTRRNRPRNKPQTEPQQASQGTGNRVQFLSPARLVLAHPGTKREQKRTRSDHTPEQKRPRSHPSERVLGVC
jgi:hypothetical protein